MIAEGQDGGGGGDVATDDRRPTIDRRCAQCGAAITYQSKTGLCRPHAIARMHASPEYQAARRAGLDRHYAQPGARKEVGDRLAAGHRRWRASMSADERARASEHGHWLVRQFLSRPDVIARAQSKEARTAATVKRTETRMGWCPPPLRPAYRHLIDCKQYRAAEARRIIEAEIEGTREHALRQIASTELAMRLRHERDRRELAG